METTWLPLESNPDVLNAYIHKKLGVSDKWSIVDVMGLDSEMLSWLPTPVKSLILLFPISDAYEKHRAEEEIRLKDGPSADLGDGLFFMKQIIHNACGTIALVHSLANNKEIAISPDGILGKYLEKARPLTVDERGKLLETDPEFSGSHEQIAEEGQTNAHSNEPVFHHFISFVNHSGVLVELDGRKSGPVPHGPTSDETFLEDAAAVCQTFIARDPSEVRFNILAIAPTQN